MANLTTALPVPEGKAYGEAIDVSGMGHDKLLIVTGHFVGVVAVEGTHGEGEKATWAKVATFTAPGRKQVKGVFRRLRAVVLEGNGRGAHCDVSGRKRETAFVTLPVPDLNGEGEAVDVSELQNDWTVLVNTGKNFAGALVVEVSHDQAGYAQIMQTFTAGALKVARVEGGFARAARMGYAAHARGEAVSVTIGAEKEPA